MNYIGIKETGIQFDKIWQKIISNDPQVRLNTHIFIKIEFDSKYYWLNNEIFKGYLPIDSNFLQPKSTEIRMEDLRLDEFLNSIPDCLVDGDYLEGKLIVCIDKYYEIPIYKKQNNKFSYWHREWPKIYFNLFELGYVDEKELSEFFPDWHKQTNIKQDGASKKCDLDKNLIKESEKNKNHRHTSRAAELHAVLDSFKRLFIENKIEKFQRHNFTDIYDTPQKIFVLLGSAMTNPHEAATRLNCPYPKLVMELEFKKFHEQYPYQASKKKFSRWKNKYFAQCAEAWIAKAKNKES